MTTIAGRYELGEEIGLGGMAKVFKATDTRLGRAVALKVLAPSFAHDEAFVARFQREAQAAARLNHPNIVSVYDSGTVGDIHYMVMELVQGRTLSEMLAQDGRLLPERAEEIEESVCSALAAAHAQGIVHRDIKPGNIMLASHGEVKVMDFGIARMDSGQTVAQTQAVLGTASYLSPEQAQGGPVDARSDIYSAGVVLYEMLTGKPPFAGDTAVSVAMQHVQETPTPPSQVTGGIPPELEAVILRAMAKNPANRYQTAEEFRRDLGLVRAGGRASAPGLIPPAATQMLSPAETPTLIEPPSRTGRWAIGILIVLVVAAFAFGAFLLGRELLGGKGGGSPTSPAAVSVAVPNLYGMTLDGATSSLTTAKLAVGEVKYKTNPAPADTVYRQEPASGQSVQQGATIDIWIAQGASPTSSPTPTTATVPDVTGMTQHDAAQALKSAGFKVGGVTEEASSSVPDGEVIRQDPKDGVQHALGRSVDLVVSAGKGTVTVPDLTCLQTAKATTKLAGLGLSLNIVLPTSPNPACPHANRVGSQDTAPGTEVPPGTTIDVHVAGP